MSNIKQDSLRGVKWSAIERFSVQGIQFLLGLIMARLLSPTDYGIVGMLAIFIAVGQSFVDCGFSNALIRKKDCTEKDFSTVFFFNIAVGGVAYGAMFAIAPLVASFFQEPVLKDVLRVLAINLFLNSLAVVQRAKMTIAIDFRSQAIATFGSSFVSGGVGIYLAYSGYGVWSLVYQSVLATLLNVLLLWLLSRWRPSLVFSRKSFNDLFSYGSKILAAGLLHTIYVNMTTFVVGKFYTPQDLGFYTRGQQIAALPSTNMTLILQRVTFPILAKIQDDDSRLIKVYRKYISMTSMGIFFLMILLASLAKPLVVILLTQKWLDSVIFLQIFCFSLMFDHLNQINLNLLQVKGRSDLFLKLEIIKKTISFAILFASIPFGVIAICLSKVLYTQIAIVINTYYTGKLFGLGYFKQWADFVKYFLFSMLACAPALLLSIVDANPFVALSLGGCSSIMLYVIMLRKDYCMNEVLKIVFEKIQQIK